LNHCCKLKQIRRGVRYERDKGTGKGLGEEDGNPPHGPNSSWPFPLGFLQ